MLIKLIEIQKTLKAPKNLYNKFGGYNYRNAEGILEAVKPLLAKHDLALFITDEVVQVGERYYVKATATITNGEKEYSVSAYAREDENKKGMDGSQLTGSCSSYARKYALNGLFLLDDTKDADTDEFAKQATNKAQSKCSEEEIKKAQEAGVDIDKLAKYLKKDVASLTSEELQKAIATKQKAKQKQEELKNATV